MKAYTYTDGKITAGTELPGIGNQKTCALTLNIPCDWDVDTFISRLKGREHADLMLYCCVTLSQGDSISSVFPETCVLLNCSDPLLLENHLNSCFELYFDDTTALYILMDGSELLDTKANVYIRNDSGKLKLHQDSSLVEEEDDTEDTVLIL